MFDLLSIQYVQICSRRAWTLPRCSDRVYAAKEVVCEGQKWHKTCFGCKDCGKKLDSTTCNSHDGKSDYSCPQARVV